MNYEVVITKAALKVLRLLPADLCRRIESAYEALGTNPHPTGSKRLKGSDRLRIRVAGWRIIYTVEDTLLVVTVVKIGARGGVYKGRRPNSVGPTRTQHAAICLMLGHFLTQHSPWDADAQFQADPSQSARFRSDAQEQRIRRIDTPKSWALRPSHN